MKTALVSSSTHPETLTMKEIKDHLRIGLDETDHDNVLISLRKAAREHVENYTGRKLLPNQTWYAYFDNWSTGKSMDIPYSPLVSISSSGIYYTDSTSGSTTFGSSAWSIDIASEPGRVVLDNDEDWPTDILHQNNPIRIEFVCGYSTSAIFPQPIKQAMLLLIGHWFENREATIVNQTISRVPDAVDALLASYRIFQF